MRGGPPLNVIATAREGLHYRRSVSAGQARSDRGGAPSRRCDYNDSRGSEPMFEPRIHALLRSCCRACRCACGPAPTPPPAKGDELVALLRPGPVDVVSRPDGRSAGLRLRPRAACSRNVHDLVLKVVAASDPRARLAAGDQRRSVGAGGAVSPSRPPADDPAASAACFQRRTTRVEPVLIYNIDRLSADVVGRSRGNQRRRAGGQRARSRALAARAHRAPRSSVEVDRAVLGRSADRAGLRRNARLRGRRRPTKPTCAQRPISISSVHSRRRSSTTWLGFRTGAVALRDQVDAFFARLQERRHAARLIERYFARVQVPRIDAGVFQERIKSVLPQYRASVREARRKPPASNGGCWRRSRTRNRNGTRRRPARPACAGSCSSPRTRRVTSASSDRLDPQASALGAARYLQRSQGQAAARIAEPDRTWLALAAYNIGIAHLEDARILAQKQKHESRFVERR